MDSVIEVIFNFICITMQFVKKWLISYFIFTCVPLTCTVWLVSVCLDFIKRARLESEIADTSQDDNRKTATHTIQLQLRKLCDKTKTDLALQVPDLFWELVGHMRKMDASNLRVLYEKVSHTSFCGRSNDFVLWVYFQHFMNL